MYTCISKYWNFNDYYLIYVRAPSLFQTRFEIHCFEMIIKWLIRAALLLLIVNSEVFARSRPYNLPFQHNQLKKHQGAPNRLSLLLLPVHKLFIRFGCCYMSNALDSKSWFLWSPENNNLNFFCFTGVREWKLDDLPNGRSLYKKHLSITIWIEHYKKLTKVGTCLEWLL